MHASSLELLSALGAAPLHETVASMTEEATKARRNMFKTILGERTAERRSKEASLVFTACFPLSLSTVLPQNAHLTL